MPRHAPDMKYLLQKYILSKNVNIKHFPKQPHFNCNTLIELCCNENVNHSYKMSITQIKRKTHDPTICPHCKKEKKYEKMGIPRFEIEDYCNKNNFNYTPKKDFYNRWTDSLKLICKIDNNCIEIKSLAYWETHKQKIICDVCEIQKLGLLNKNEYDEKIEQINQINENFEIPNTTNNKEMTINVIKILQTTNWHAIEYNGTTNKSKFICKICGYIHETIVGNLSNCFGCLSIKNKQNVYEKLKNICKDNNIFIKNPINCYKNIDLPISFKCNSCGYEFNFNWSQITGKYYKVSCPNCYKSTKRQKETEIYEFIKSFYNGEIIQNDKNIINPKELDIFIPEYNLAIEFCGNIWHSEKYNTNKQYHKQKLIKCMEKNIKLITIFEDEWDDKNEICKSKIKNLLHKTNNKIFARKCIIKELSNQESKEFCEKNHIQGYCKSTSINYGLIYNNSIVSIMCFNKTIKSRNSDYELNRFCNILDHNIPGAFSKLLNYFKLNNTNKSLTSYSDNRWGLGGVYLKNGFILEKEIPVRYFYVGNCTLWKRKHRFTFNKNRLKKLYNIVDNQSEAEITKNNEIYKIWDCGYKKWRLC